jgi:beta-glucosidase
MTATNEALELATRLPSTFVWGAATSAYQIEGAAAEDGKGRSIWDALCERPGAIVDGSSGVLACDHYHRYADDVAMMAALGIQAYRFSLSWSRIQPDGSSRVEPRGVAFYDRLVDELLSAGIEPWATLYHWDLPEALSEMGGWPERDTAYRFAEYAQVAHGALNDRVRSWTTLNEPYCSAFLGYASGEHAPGVKDPVAAVRSVHHLLLAHGLAVQALRTVDPGVQIGIVLNTYPVEPASDRPADVDAARRIDGLQNRIFMDPVLRGSYPADVVDDVKRFADLSGSTATGLVRPGDLDVISQPTDLLGLNYYTSYLVSGGSESADRGGLWVGASDVVFHDQGLPRTAMGWEIDPDGLRRSLARVSEDYPGIPLYVTENGAAFPDLLGTDGVSDRDRVDFVASHVGAVARAIEDGADVRGYFTWSLMDNFEWAWGYSQRFGIVHVDYDTLVRTPKASARWYQEAIAAHGGRSD